MSPQSRVVLVIATLIAIIGTWSTPQPADAAGPPKITRASPASLSAAGATRVKITGKNLGHVTAVYFGRAKATRITHVSKNTLIVIAPAHSVGSVKLKLRAGKRTYTTSITVRFTAPTTQPTSVEAEVLTLTNQARAAARTCGSSTMPAVPALTWNGVLGAVARAHSTEMVTKKYFAHDSADGAGFSTRITRAGYSWNAVGENIAAGQATAAAVMAAWLKSPGHCQNIMSAGFTELGVGFATGGSWGTTWTQDFGRPSR
jgi:uncharacterized protein YkwD